MLDKEKQCWKKANFIENNFKVFNDKENMWHFTKEQFV